jgi:hypothetical protein
MDSSDIVTIRVPGAFARAWNIVHGDDNSVLDAVRRDLAVAWEQGEVRKAGIGTVRVIRLSRALARHFAQMVEDIISVEGGLNGVEGSSRHTAAAGDKLLDRMEELGINGHDAEPYTMADPVAQAALEAEAEAGRQRAIAASAQTDERYLDRQAAVKETEAWAPTITAKIDALGITSYRASCGWTDRMALVFTDWNTDEIDTNAAARALEDEGFVVRRGNYRLTIMRPGA